VVFLLRYEPPPDVIITDLFFSRLQGDKRMQRGIIPRESTREVFEVHWRSLKGKRRDRFGEE